MIDRQFLQTVPQYGIGGFVGKIFKNVKKAVKKVAEPAGAALGFMIGGPAGASIGAGIGSLVAGKKPQRALQSAALAYGIGNLAGAGAFGSTIKGMSGKGIPTFGLTDGNLFSGIGSKGQLLSSDLFNFGGGTKEVSALEKEANSIVNTGLKLDGSAATFTEQMQANNYLNSLNKKGGLPPLAKAGIYGVGAISPFLVADAARKEQENFDAIDPNQLNTLYYSNPEEYQLAGQGVSPYYFNTLQEQAGFPTSDLPTDFVRGVAEGGIIQLADGSEKYFPRKNGAIDGPGTGTSDDIPAMLSDGEFVFTAKAVRNAGGGDRREGAKRMYQTMKNLEKGGKLSLESRGQAA